MIGSLGQLKIISKDLLNLFKNLRKNSDFSKVMTLRYMDIEETNRRMK